MTLKKLFNVPNCDPTALLKKASTSKNDAHLHMSTIPNHSKGRTNIKLNQV